MFRGCAGFPTLRSSKPLKELASDCRRLLADFLEFRNSDQPRCECVSDVCSSIFNFIFCLVVSMYIYGNTMTTVGLGNRHQRRSNHGSATAGSARVCMTEQKKGSDLESWCELVED